MLKKIRILTQKYTPQKYTLGTHKQRIRWLLAASTIPLLGILTAFGIAPYSLPENVPAIGGFYYSVAGDTDRIRYRTLQLAGERTGDRDLPGNPHAGGQRGFA